jgi:uncharacterized protein with HEPN domain
MHNRCPEFFLIDILIAIDKIKRKTALLTFDSYCQDEDCVDATLRNLEIIGEATNQLLKQPNFFDKTNIEWRKIVDFRNLVIHFYFGIDLDLAFNGIIKQKIPLLEQSIIDILKKKSSAVGVHQALEGAIADLQKMHRVESIAYLTQIKHVIIGELP